MSGRNAEAIAAALAALREPHLTRLAQRSNLPNGMTLLLEVAAGEPPAVERARAVTGRSPATLQKAAGFFIEQVLLTRQSDHYRVLGAVRDTPPEGLRRHMALLLKWLHPDVVPDTSDSRGFNRSAYVSLITEAWEALKTAERRAAYNMSLNGRHSHTGTRGVRSNGNGINSAAGALRSTAQRRPGKRTGSHRPRSDSFLTRLLSYIGRYR